MARTASAARWHFSLAGFPVGGYYDSSFVSPSGKGRLLTMVGHDNNATVNALMRALLMGNDTYSGIMIKERTYFSAAYDDLLDERHVEFFQVSGVGAAQHMTAVNGRRIFDEWTNAQPKVQLNQLTQGYVYAKLDALAPK
jgi:hypothetical protein